MIWPKQAFLTLAALGALLAAPHFVEPLKPFRLAGWSQIPRLLDFQPRPETLAAVEEGLSEAGAAVGVVEDEALADPGHVLDDFYAALLRTERDEPGAVTRVLHYGDSPTTADLITADLREQLQRRFGDAGHGLHLPARPWAWYGHRGVQIRAKGWRIAPVTQRGEADGWYGVAGASFTGWDGASTEFTLRGRGHERMVVHYARGPGGGLMAVEVEGEEIAAVETGSEVAAPGWWTVALPGGAREVELVVKRGPVRVFAVSFESSGPGVIYDSLGLNGASAATLVYSQSEAHWAAQLRGVRPSLVVLNYGTNESGFDRYVATTYRDDVRKMIQRVKRALPGTPVLVMSPMDRGVRESAGEIGTVPALPGLVKIQREVALEEGCAFFNTFASMGGAGTMGKWYSIQPRLVSADFIHPLPAGGRIVANLLERSLMRGYNVYKLRLLRSAEVAEARP